MKPIKTFKDLLFKEHPSWNGIQAEMAFDNGYSISIIRAKDECGQYGGSYGHEQGLYEAAVLLNNRLCYDTHITDDVIGYLDEDGVSEVMGLIQELQAKP